MKANIYYLGTSACNAIADSYMSSIDNSGQKVNTFDEKICISYREGRHWKNLFYKPEELKKALPYMALRTNRAYYITNQSLYGKAQKRTTDNLFSFHNIIIDIDAHDYLKENDLDYDFQEKIDELIFRINKDIGEIKPNFIVKTSRGIQCWWNFEETSKVLSFAYTRAVNTLCRVISDIITENSLNSVFSVDSSSKKKLALFRLPGSYNPKTQKSTEICYYHNKKLDFNEFNNYVSEYFELHWNPKKKKQKPKVVPISKADQKYMPLLIKRTRLLETLVEKGMVNVGIREVAMFLFFNSARQLPFFDSTPEEQTRQLNSKLADPLTNAELEAIFRNKKIYMISNRLFYDYLNITESDIKEIYMTKSNFSRDYERHLNKQNRNKEIVRRYKINEQSILGISKEMGISRNTVKSVLRELGFISTERI